MQFCSIDVDGRTGHVELIVEREARSTKGTFTMNPSIRTAFALVPLFALAANAGCAADVGEETRAASRANDA